MKRWRRWFGLCAGLVLCVEACMFMVEAPNNSHASSLRDRAEWWIRGLWAPAPVFTMNTSTTVKVDHLVVDDVDDDEAIQLVAQSGDPAATKDWPMFGGTPQRNMANPTARNIPADWSVKEDKPHNLKWMAALGSKSYGGPVVADGKVFFGTNNDVSRDPKVKGQRAVLMCFNEADGKFLWQAAHEITSDKVSKEGLHYGLCSVPCVEGKRHYYVTPACEVICADNDTGKAFWRYDLIDKQKVAPFHLGNCSPLIVDDLVMIVTGNGLDDKSGVVASPKAPSFIALDKTTGKPAWQCNLPGAKIIDGQWSNPAVATVRGKKQVIFPGGDCWLYSFEPKTGTLIWKCNCNPLRDGPKADKEFDPYFLATPVVDDGRCYIGLGVYPGGPKTPPAYSYMLCLDVSGKGDVSPRNLVGADVANKGSALVWSFGGPIDPLPKKGRKAHFGRTLSTCAIHDGLLYISEEMGYMYCLDAKSGARYWEEDLRSNVWGSPYYADGKVFLGIEDGEVIVYAHGKQMKKLARIDMDEGIHSTPVVANGVLYVSTWSKLYAIAAKK